MKIISMIHLLNILYVNIVPLLNPTFKKFTVCPTFREPSLVLIFFQRAIFDIVGGQEKIINVRLQDHQIFSSRYHHRNKRYNKK